MCLSLDGRVPGRRAGIVPCSQPVGRFYGDCPLGTAKIGILSRKRLRRRPEAVWPIRADHSMSHHVNPAAPGGNLSKGFTIRNRAGRLGVEGHEGAKALQSAGIVLCGGRSSRMGLTKAMLPFGPELLLQRVVRRLGEAVRPVVVAAHAGQELPALPPWVHVVHDCQDDIGPMEGLKQALEWLQGSVEFAFVSGCDAPWLKPRFVSRMLELADGFDIALPHVHGFDEPLAAAYRTNILAEVRQLLTARSYSVASLFDRVATRRVSIEEFARSTRVCNRSSTSTIRQRTGAP